jgi:glycosyltransferase involved in cell wall biosynthesis
VHQITLEAKERAMLAPLVLAYYGLKGPAIEAISRVLAAKILPFAGHSQVIHNGRVGREGISYASLKVARALDIPFIFTPLHHPRWVGWNYRHYLALYKKADGVIALTEAEKRLLATLGVNEARIFVTGIAPILSDIYDGERFRQEHGIKGAMVLFLGQKYWYKGIDALLKAAQLVWKTDPDVYFVFIGPPTPYSKRLFQNVTDCRIIELGSISLEEKTSALAACDVFCLPSTQESFGGVLTEAWMMEKPVVAGVTPATSEIVREGETGFLVSQKPQEIAERLKFVLDNPALAKRTALAGKALVESRYTWPLLAQKTLDVYRRVLESG